MEALDTNILVRLATRDDAAQLRKAERLMRQNSMDSTFYEGARRAPRLCLFPDPHSTDILSLRSAPCSARCPDRQAIHS